MYKPKVSIIIPAYNSEYTISRAINSVIDQSYINKEIIVVDDGSRDQTEKIIEKYKETVKIIKTNHLGVSNARNTGIKKSSGDYIMFLDSDDYLLSDCLNIMMDNIKGFDILCCSFLKKNKKRIGIYHLENQNINQEQFIRRVCKIDSNYDYMYIWGKLFKRSVITNDLFPVNITIGEDVVALIKATLKAHKIKIMDKSVYVYDRGESVTTKLKFEHNYLDLYEVWNLIKKEFDKENPSYIEYADINIWRQDYTILARILLSGEKKRKENIKIIKEANERLKRNYRKLLSSRIVLSRKITILIVLFITNAYLKLRNL